MRARVLPNFNHAVMLKCFSSCLSLAKLHFTELGLLLNKNIKWFLQQIGFLSTQFVTSDAVANDCKN